MTPNWPFPAWPQPPMRDEPPPPIREPKQRARPKPWKTPEGQEALL